MALLGLMSLSGILIKNAIVLIGQVDVELAAGTTIFGMLSLMTAYVFCLHGRDNQFGPGFAIIVMLIVVPVLYAIFFKIPFGVT
jgi:multidrug efflux pump subunit AcrB